MTSSTSFLQINLQKCQLAQDLMWQKLSADGVDLAVVSEPYNLTGAVGWHQDRTGLAAIGICPKCPNVPREIEQGDGFVAARFSNFTVYSCYISPNCSFAEFEDFLGKLGNSISRRQGQKLIVAGDFNAKAEEWQSGWTNQRGYALCELIDEKRLQTLNLGNEPTRFHQGVGSRIDVTFASESLAQLIRGWKVLDEDSGSDHRYILFSLHREVEVTAPKKLRRWAVKKMSTDRLRASYLTMLWNGDEADNEEAGVESAAAKLMGTVTKACDAAMPRCGPPRKKKAVYWWTDEIAQLHRESNCKRRKYQRCRGRVEAREAAELYQRARRRLKSAIKSQKKAAFNELCDLVNDDPFGKSYKVVMKKMSGPPTASRMEPSEVEKVIDALFPQHPALRVLLPEVVEDEVPLVSIEEVDAAIERIRGKKGKAPGPNQIPYKVWSALHEVDSSSQLVKVMNQALREGSFPEKWKISNLALTPKPGKPPGKPSSFRPLCLSNTDGKIFERIVATRLENHLETRKVISGRQYGFRAGISTADAARKLKKIVLANRRKNQLCAAVSLDIKNAFNSIPWRHVLETLVEAKVPDYLLRIIRSYLDHRVIEVETSTGN